VPLDTSPEAWAVFLDIQRRMTPEEKIARVFELSERVKAMAEAGLRHRYPDASDEEIRMRAIRQRLGDELFEKVYGQAVSPLDPK
jgi:two-component sensor histidine kinase